MTPRDMTPDELEDFEEDIVQHSDEVLPDHGPASEPAVAKEIDRDRDGLPDNPAAYRVPS
jgi:hypothetical protein